MANPYTPIPYASNGLWNARTIKAFQVWAKRKGYYPKNYMIDGKEGHGTRVALQKWLKADGTYKYGLDGVIRRDSVDALRRTLDKHVNWGFTVTMPNGTKVTEGGKLPKLNYFPSTKYVLKLQAFLTKQN